MFKFSVCEDEDDDEDEEDDDDEDEASSWLSISSSVIVECFCPPLWIKEGVCDEDERCINPLIDSLNLFFDRDEEGEEEEEEEEGEE